MSRNSYITPIDAIRRVDASIEQADIGTNFSIPVSSETLISHIEGVEAEFERRAVEMTDQTATDELHEGISREHGWTIYLDESDIKPFDTNAGDKVELRSGEDTWTDVTDESFVDTEMGVVEIDRRHLRVSPTYPTETNYRFRVTYRYGTGGDEAGETTLAESIDESDTAPLTVDVSDSSQIQEGEVILIGGDEYAFVSAVDENAETITLSERAIRGTTAVTHTSGDTVSYIPLNVRDAISAKVATRLLRQDDFQDFLNEGQGDNIDNQQKIDDLEAEFEATIGRYTTSSGYV